jgi:gas vesicle protein
MAFLGSLGKIFLGGASTGQAIGALTGNPALAMAAQSAAEGISKIKKSGSTNLSQGTATSIPDAPASETSTSGSSDAQNLIFNVGNQGTGGIVPASYGMNIPGAGRGRLQQSSPEMMGGSIQPAFFGSAAKFLFGTAAGMIAPMIIDPVTGAEKKLRVTRRLRSQVKQAVQMFGVDAVAEQMGVSQEVIFYILTKKMRNDGAYVTKAAVRKTRQTVRKMKSLCDMYDDLRPPARRATARRTASKTTLIKN